MNSISTDVDDDKLHEECGVFGVFQHDDAAALTALGLHALQHRGQEAAGIFTHNGQQFFSDRRMGLVGDNFNRKDVIERLKGRQAIGHVRYSTTGGASLQNIQPLYAESGCGGFAVCHNGNLTNALVKREDLIKDGSIFHTTSDTEVILHLIARSKKKQFYERFIEALLQVQGGYALIGMTENEMVGVRDPFGIRPLVLGKIDDSYVLASETCALDIINATFIREIDNGEVIIINESGIKSYRPYRNYPIRPRPCVFEYIYFSRPDSIVGGRCVYDVRKNMGVQLALESTISADVVVPIPDSGVPAAIGFSRESGIPFELGIIRNHYVGRTFIEPEQKIRKLGVKLKHSANCAAIEGKRVILIDDSVVRGTTSSKIVQMVREAGATEVHMRIASPPIKYPDFYGIDTPDKSQLLAANNTLDQMRDYMGADSLHFISVDGVYRAMGFENGRDNDKPQFTDHCFTGDYPTELKDQEGQMQDKQLSLLSEFRE